MTIVRTILIATLLPVLLVGCAAALEGDREARPSANLITTEEIEETNARDLYELVERLRPRWLTARAGRGMHAGIVVYRGTTRLGDLSVLRQLGPESVRQLRFLDGATASASLPGIGSGHVAGAIVLDGD